MSEAMITGLAPSRSSSWPDEIVAMPATTFAAMPNAITRFVDSPSTTRPSTPPKVKTPVSEAVTEDRAREQEPDRVRAVRAAPLF
jgi:hypothetical protein